MIRVSVSLANATVTETETLTAGRVGLECAFAFSSEWDGLAKVAVFEGAETIEVALGADNVTTVPPECMATAGYNLRVGVYGLSASDAIVIPTVWAKAGKIKDSAAPDDESFAPATPELVAQIIETSNTALDIAQSVAEQAASGAFNGAPGEPGVSPTITSSEITNGHRLTITDVNGETVVDVMNGDKGDTGDTGPQGDPFTFDDFTDAQLAALTGPTGPQGPAGPQGEPGEDGVSPTVTITEITGGHRVTITDAEHPSGQSFDVMDGTGGGGGGTEEVFWATYGTTTYTEINTAYTAGNVVLCQRVDDYGTVNRVFALVERTPASNQAKFACVRADAVYFLTCTNSTWAETSVPIAVDSSLSSSSTNPVQNKVIKTALDAKGTYSKPSGGIPATDLASAVQTSLGKADTALQSFTETDPTVPSWAKASSKPSYTASEVGAIAAPSSPSSGQYLAWNGSAWVAQSLPIYNGGVS